MGHSKSIALSRTGTSLDTRLSMELEAVDRQSGKSGFEFIGLHRWHVSGDFWPMKKLHIYT